MDLHPPPGSPSRKEEDGDRVGEGLRHAAVGVLGSGAPLHGEYADPVPVADTAETVGHVDPGALLPGDDGAYALLGPRHR